MARKCLLMTLTLAVALVGTVRFDGVARSRLAEHRLAVQNSNASPLQHSLLRTERDNDLSQLNSTEVRFTVLEISARHDGQTLATIALLARSSADLQEMNLHGLCVKLQV